MNKFKTIHWLFIASENYNQNWVYSLWESTAQLFDFPFSEDGVTSERKTQNGDPLLSIEKVQMMYILLVCLSPVISQSYPCMLQVGPDWSNFFTRNDYLFWQTFVRQNFSNFVYLMKDAAGFAVSKFISQRLEDVCEF